MTTTELQNYDSNEWRLLIDISKRGLKCVFFIIEINIEPKLKKTLQYP